MEQILYYDLDLGELNVGLKTNNGYCLKTKVLPREDYKQYALDKSQIKLNSNFSKQIIIIDSSNSGTGRSNRNIYDPIIQPVFAKLNIVHEYILTDSFDSIKTIAQNLKSGTYLVILISGDTSVNEFINAINPSEHGNITIFNIPFGTGNSLGLSLDLHNELDAIAKLLHNNPVPKPFNLYDLKLPENTMLLQQNERIGNLPLHYKFFVVFSWGFHASLVADSDTPEMRQYGIDRFKMAALKSLESVQEYNGVTTITSKDGTNRVINGPYSYWLLTPSKKFEPTFVISPHGNVLNDKLFLISFNPGNDIMNIMQQVYANGSHITNNQVKYEQINGDEQIKLVFTDLSVLFRRFCIDGSIIEVPATGEIIIQSCNNRVRNWEFYLLI